MDIYRLIMKRDLIVMVDLEGELENLIDRAIILKKQAKSEALPELLKNKSFALIFEKPSTRTRISFEAAIAQFGGHPIYLNPNDMQMGRGETISDTGYVLSRFVSGIIYRAFDYRNVVELAKKSTIPVINALDNREHPCQIVADLMTIKEKKKKFKDVTICYVGDGNNVCNSLMVGAAMVGMNIVVATPKGHEPDLAYVKTAEKFASNNKSSIKIMNDPVKAVKDADFIYTDVWVSMGEEKLKDKEKDFDGYQVNMNLVKKAKKNVMVMHCLPAHRGVEITDEVIDSKYSIVFDQAENRLHSEAAILLHLLEV